MMNSDLLSLMWMALLPVLTGVSWVATDKEWMELGPSSCFTRVTPWRWLGHPHCGLRSSSVWPRQLVDWLWTYNMAAQGFLSPLMASSELAQLTSASFRWLK